MSNEPETIDGTIVIPSPAQVVDGNVAVDMAKAVAEKISEATRKSFAYGDGSEVKLSQGKYAFVLIGIADQPVTPEQFFQLSAVIQAQCPFIRAVGTVRQDYVPEIADDYTAAMVGELRLIAYPTPATEETDEDNG